ncbi:MAG: hypothetical protein HQK50_02955 [Oligoflexia bacterium]|nr:hypothetical protein [Oligoflexia bacterium]MBF0364501.1 hypothetical protein [Oligoflexia bacterium]
MKAITTIVTIFLFLFVLTTVKADDAIENLFIDNSRPVNSSVSDVPFPLPAPPASTGMRLLGERTIDINFELLTDPNQESFMLNLTGDLRVLVWTMKVVWRSPTNFTWYGFFDGRSVENIIITVIDGRAYSYVKYDNRNFIIRTILGNSGQNRDFPINYSLAEVAGDLTIQKDDALYPPHYQNLQKVKRVPEEGTHQNQNQNQDLIYAKADDDGSLIDVLVVYTTAVNTGASAMGGIDLIIQSAEDGANLALSNASVNYSIRIVQAQQVAYEETGNLSTDLNRITGTSDGYLDEIHTIRTQVGADFVSFWTDYIGGPYAGLGWLLTPGSVAYNAPYAFSTIAILNYSSFMLTFTHELGHNWGAHHDRANASGSGAYSYSYGYYTGTYGTVMSYLGTRLYYFSNPEKSYNGHVLGVSSDNATTSADNRLTLNNMAAQGASYTSTVVDTTTTTTTNNRGTNTTTTRTTSSSTPLASLTIKESSTVVEGCFFATAIYGTPWAREVRILRHFRNKYLSTSDVGRSVVKSYYRHSPGPASKVGRFLRKHPMLRKAIQYMLLPMISLASYTSSFK